MSGPIVRSAPNKKFTQNWDVVFGGKKSAAKSGKSPASPAKQAAKQAASRPGQKKAAKKKKA